LAPGACGAAACAKASVRARQNKLAARIVSRVKKIDAAMERSVKLASQSLTQEAAGRPVFI
jgi:hypothetical protein